MRVPKLEMYNPSIGAMNKKQVCFYRVVEESLRKGKYIELEGNIGYVFVYLYSLLNKWDKIGFENLSEYLIYISELYKDEKKLSDYCLFWAYDCLLGLKKYETYLEKTEPVAMVTHVNHNANLRLNIQNKLGLDANPIDIIILTRTGRKSKFISSNTAIYKDKIREVFHSYSENNESWFDIANRECELQCYPHYLFMGTSVKGMPEMEFLIRGYKFSDMENVIKELAKDAENLARTEMGVPLIGEGWVSETELFKKLEAEFSMTRVIQHGRPEFLGRQHFDIWFPNWKVAIEYHGKQHFEPVSFFGGAEAFTKNQERDQRKIELASKNNVKLFVVAEGYDLDSLIFEIYSHQKSKVSQRLINVTHS